MVDAALNRAEFMPPRYSSEPESARWNENLPLATLPWLTSVWKRGEAPSVEIDW